MLSSEAAESMVDKALRMGADSYITKPVTMEELEKAINERVSFLKEQINPQNKPLVNRAFEIQIETIRSANTEGVAIQILKKQKQLEIAKDLETIERLYTEIEALEWLQRQVVKHV